MSHSNIKQILSRSNITTPQALQEALAIMRHRFTYSACSEIFQQNPKKISLALIGAILQLTGCSPNELFPDKTEIATPDTTTPGQPPNSDAKAKKRKKNKKPYEKKPLTASQIRLLGTRPDTELAKKFKLSSATVSKKRTMLNIPECPRGILVTDKQIALLGTMPDKKLAHKWGMNKDVITKKRKALNIPPYSRKLNIPEDQKKLLGTMIDRELAAKTGLSLATITVARICEGIPSFRQRQQKEKAHATQDEQQTHTQPPIYTAAILRLGQETINMLLTRIGKMPDSAIAMETGINDDTISHLRHLHKIPRYSPLNCFPEGVIKRLGKMTDLALAKLSGKTTQQIRYKRDTLNIPPFGHRNSLLNNEFDNESIRDSKDGCMPAPAPNTDSLTLEAACPPWYEIETPEHLTEDVARQLLQSARWPFKPVCIYCGKENLKKLGYKRLFYCRDCRKKFNIRHSTPLEKSRTPTRLIILYWVLADKGIPAYQACKILNISRTVALKLSGILETSPLAKKVVSLTLEETALTAQGIINSLAPDFASNIKNKKKDLPHLPSNN